MIQIHVNEKIYSKDPEGTALGKKIVSESIVLLDELGLEEFTFKKLSIRIGSTEASIYRYFENKHRLLTYLISWYWNWVEYQIKMRTYNITDDKEKLKICISLFTTPINMDMDFEHINEQALHRIVLMESAKSYFRKGVDEDNKEGLFSSYKRVTNLVSSFIRSVKPDYKYPEALISTMIEGAHQQLFFAQHLPSLTNVQEKTNSTEEFFTDLIFKTIEIE